VTDPDFSNRIARITDASLDPSQTNKSVLAGCGGSQGDFTFNTNSTLLVVCNTNTRAYPMQFNPSTMQVTKLYVGATGFPNGYFIGNAATFSRSNPYLLYVLTGTVIKAYCLDALAASVCSAAGPLDTVNPPTVANGRIYTVYDFTASNSCLGTAIFPSGFTPNWANFGQYSANDSSFTPAYSYDIGGTATYSNGSPTVTLVTGTFDKRYKAGKIALDDGNHDISAFTGCTGTSCTGITLASNALCTGCSGATNTTFTENGFQGSGVNVVTYVPGSGWIYPTSNSSTRASGQPTPQTRPAGQQIVASGRNCRPDGKGTFVYFS
jgi:hypothetical protein